MGPRAGGRRLVLVGRRAGGPTARGVLVLIGLLRLTAGGGQALGKATHGGYLLIRKILENRSLSTSA